MQELLSGMSEAKSGQLPLWKRTTFKCKDPLTNNAMKSELKQAGTGHRDLQFLTHVVSKRYHLNIPYTPVILLNIA